LKYDVLNDVITLATILLNYTVDGRLVFAEFSGKVGGTAS